MIRNTKWALTIVLGVAIGLAFMLMASGANYKVVVDPNVYTAPLDGKDEIYRGLSLHPDWQKRYGSNERTLIFYNLRKERAEIDNLKKRLEKAEQQLKTVLEAAGIENLTDPNLYGTNLDSNTAPKDPNK